MKKPQVKIEIMIEREKNLSTLLAKLLGNVNLVVLCMCGVGESETLLDTTRLYRKEFYIITTISSALSEFRHKFWTQGCDTRRLS